LDIFGGGAKHGTGSGSVRSWDEPQVVLVRALVLISRIQRPDYRQFRGAEDKVRAAWTADPDLNGVWLILAPGTVYVGSLFFTAEVAVVVDLAAAARHVREAFALAG
jgi:hypothetical protein